MQQRTIEKPVVVNSEDVFIKHKNKLLKELQKRRLNEGTIMRKEFKKYKVKPNSSFSSIYKKRR